MPILLPSQRQRKTQLPLPTRSEPPARVEDDNKPRFRMERFKPWLEIVKGAAAVLVFLATPYWFLQQRLNKPNLKLDQTVTQRAVDGNSALTLITLDVRATNIGKIKVDLDSGKVKLQQINPVGAPGETAPEMAFDLRKITLEPGESDQAIFKTVEIPSSVHTLQISTVYAVPGTKNYWTLQSAVDIGTQELREEAASSVH